MMPGYMDERENDRPLPSKQTSDDRKIPSLDGDVKERLLMPWLSVLRTIMESIKDPLQ